MNPFSIIAINKVAAREGMRLGNAEKDYVLSVVLSEISKLEIARQLVFKGGTALKKAYFPKYRFSSDLDFTAIKLDKESVKKELERVFSNKSYGGISFVKTSDDSREEGKNLTLVLKYESQISKVEGRTQSDSVKLDINFENTVELSAVERQLISPPEYGLNASFRVMAREEIAAEKVHAIYSRAKPRDLYDLWFLLTGGVIFNEELINKKLKRLKTDEEDVLVFEVEYFRGRISGLKPRWEQDVGSLINNYPAFEDAELDVLKNSEGPNVTDCVMRIWICQIKKYLKENNTPALRIVFKEISEEAQSSKLLQHLELRELCQTLIASPTFKDGRSIEFLLAIYVNQFYFFRNLVSESAKQLIESLISFFAQDNYTAKVRIYACHLLLAADTPKSMENFLAYVRMEKHEVWKNIEPELAKFPTASNEMKEKLYEKLFEIVGGDSSLEKRVELLLSSLRNSLKKEPPLVSQRKLRAATAEKQPRKKKIPKFPVF